MYESQDAGIDDWGEEREARAGAIAECAGETLVSNGSLAGRLLVGHPAFPSVVAFVERKPRAAPAIVASLGVAGVGPASQVLPTLASAKRPDVQEALLRLIVAGPCDANRPAGAAHPVAALAGSRSAAVDRMASLATLRLAACPPRDNELEALRPRATSSLELRLRDLDDHAIVEQIGWLGKSADAFVTPLLGRFPQAPKEKTAIIKVFAGVGSRRAFGHTDAHRRPPGAPVLPLDPGARGPGGHRRGGGPGEVRDPLGPAGFVPPAARPCMMSLARIDAKLDRRRVFPPGQSYEKECDFNSDGRLLLDRGDASCPELSQALFHLAKLGGIRFGPSNARDDGQQ